MSHGENKQQKNVNYFTPQGATDNVQSVPFYRHFIYHLTAFFVVSTAVMLGIVSGHSFRVITLCIRLVECYSWWRGENHTRLATQLPRVRLHAFEN